MAQHLAAGGYRYVHGSAFPHPLCQAHAGECPVPPPHVAQGAPPVGKDIPGAIFGSGSFWNGCLQHVPPGPHHVTQTNMGIGRHPVPMNLY